MCHCVHYQHHMRHIIPWEHAIYQHLLILRKYPHAKYLGGNFSFFLLLAMLLFIIPPFNSGTIVYPAHDIYSRAINVSSPRLVDGEDPQSTTYRKKVSHLIHSIRHMHHSTSFLNQQLIASNDILAVYYVRLCVEWKYHIHVKSKCQHKVHKSLTPLLSNPYVPLSYHLPRLVAILIIFVEWLSIGNNSSSYSSTSN
jgi:hypothetical protein